MAAPNAKSTELQYAPPYKPGHRIVEYRYVLPLSVEEFQRAQPYVIAKSSKQEAERNASSVRVCSSRPCCCSSAAEANLSSSLVHSTARALRCAQAIELLKNEPFADDFGTGHYSQKRYFIRDRLPSVIAKLAPKSAQNIEEHCWNAYPRIKTVLRIPFFNKASIVVLSHHVDNDDGQQENALNLSPEQLAVREIAHINVATEPVPDKEYRVSDDPAKATSKTGRLPLAADWQARSPGKMMCVYKAALVTFDYTGVQKKAELSTLETYKNVFTLSHKQAVAWMDDWLDLTLAQALDYETRTFAELSGEAASKPVEQDDPNAAPSEISGVSTTS